MIEVTTEQVELAATVLRNMRNIRLDAAERNIRFDLPLTWSYVVNMGERISYGLSDFIYVQEKVCASSNPERTLAGLIEQGIIPQKNVHLVSALSSNSVCVAFARGYERGVGARVWDIELNRHERDKVKLALLSGAVFGGSLDSEECLVSLHRTMRYSMSESFESKARSLFFGAYKGDSDRVIRASAELKPLGWPCLRMMPPDLVRRYKQFSDALFDVAKNYGVTD